MMAPRRVPGINLPLCPCSHFLYIFLSHLVELSEECFTFLYVITQLLKCFLSSPLTLKDMAKIITQAPNKSPTLALSQLLQIRQAKEMATQFHTSVLKGTSRIWFAKLSWPVAMMSEFY